MQTCNTNLKPEDCLIKIKCVCVFFENIGFPPQRFLLTPSPLTVDWWRRYCPNHDHDAEDKEIFDDDDDDDDDHDDDNDADM